MGSAAAPLPVDGLLTPRQAAALVGVSESTVRRWCDDHLVTTARTAGGHRRIVPAALVKFTRSAGFPPMREPSTGARGGRRAPAERVADRMFDALVRDAAVDLRAAVSGWITDGRGLDALFDLVVAPALTRLGAAWAEGELAVHVEHRATARLLRALAPLDVWIPQPSTRAPAAVCAALSGDPYVLGPSMAGWITAAEGFRADVLGADTPADEVLAAAEGARAKLVCISIGAAADAARLRRDVGAIWRWCEQAGAQLVVGGREQAAARGARVPDAIFGTDMADLARRVRRRRAPAGGRRASSGRSRLAREGT